jgi:hypothetical protein
MPPKPSNKAQMKPAVNANSVAIGRSARTKKAVAATKKVRDDEKERRECNDGTMMTIGEYTASQKSLYDAIKKLVVDSEHKLNHSQECMVQTLDMMWAACPSFVVSYRWKFCSQCAARVAAHAEPHRAPVLGRGMDGSRPGRGRGLCAL